MKQIFIAEQQEFSTVAADLLRSAGEVTLVDASGSDLAAAFRNFDVVWVRLAHRIDKQVLGAAPRARILATPVTGLDHIDLDACEANGIRVVSLRGEVDFLRSVRATAELTIALMLALIRRIPAARESVKRGVWNRNLFRGAELFGKTVGIVGVGRLGTIVAGYLRAFGCYVLGHDPRSDFPSNVVDHRCATLDELMTTSDVVTLHVPYGAATRHLIDEAALMRMKRGAFVVNTSRGGVIDERALLAALEKGVLGGAALDVLDGEPGITASHPVVAATQWMENLLVVPHIGGNTAESVAKTEVFLARKVIDALVEGRH